MGAYLNTPVKDKEIEAGQNDWMHFAVASMQGWRVHQEENNLLTSEDIIPTLQKLFLEFDKTLNSEKVINEMTNLKEVENGSVNSKSDAEECHELLEEAMALSSEANISLNKIIKQYTKCCQKIVKGEKRTAGEPSSRVVKRRRVQTELFIDGHCVHRTNKECDKKTVNVEEIKQDNGEVANSDSSVLTTNESGDVGTFSPKNNLKNSENGEAASLQTTSSSKEESKIDQEDDEESDDEDFVLEENDDDELEAEDSDEESENIPIPLSQSNKPGFDSGATACLTLLFKDKVIVANVGDSRAVLCRDVDHKPEDTKEKQRIEAAGGKVSDDGRVCGGIFKLYISKLFLGLNLSRALGDHYYKQKSDINLEDQMITALPDVQCQDITDKDTLLIVACDGICHCCAPDTSGDGTGCDNMTIIILDLIKNQRDESYLSLNDNDTQSKDEEK